jgi:hypothetical protein
MPQCQYLFSVVFVFQKSYIGNILRIGQNEAQSSYFPRHETESKEETERGQEETTPSGGTGALLAVPPCGVGPLGALCIAPSPIKSLRHENPKSIGVFPDKVPQCRHHRRPILGYRNLCSGTLPRWGIALEAISIDSTTISIDIVVSHDEEGVVLPWGRGLYR